MPKIEKYPPGYTDAEKRWHRFIDKMVEGLRQRCDGLKTSPLYWMASDESDVRCYGCAGKRRCGGTNSDEEDGQRFCSKCGKVLEHSFTDEGIDEEIASSTEEDMLDRPISGVEAYTLLAIIDCGWPRLTERCGDWTYRPDLKPALRIIAERLAIGQEP
jgi:hypothetical protein